LQSDGRRAAGPNRQHGAVGDDNTDSGQHALNPVQQRLRRDQLDGLDHGGAAAAAVHVQVRAAAGRHRGDGQGLATDLRRQQDGRRETQEGHCALENFGQGMPYGNRAKCQAVSFIAASFLPEYCRLI
jgi:hypothetical protein